jgi:hypothetical protein
MIVIILFNTFPGVQLRGVEAAGVGREAAGVGREAAGVGRACYCKYMLL